MSEETKTDGVTLARALSETLAAHSKATISAQMAWNVYCEAKNALWKYLRSCQGCLVVDGVAYLLDDANELRQYTVILEPQ